MIYSAKEIANYIVTVFQKRHEAITNLKLQKLVYYAQAWHLALYDEPIFKERIEAWIHGPVVPTVFNEFKAYRWQPISKPVSFFQFPEHAHRHLNEVVRVYGKFDGVTLERMTHQESPWRDVRRGLEPDEPSNRVITHEAMRKFYGAKLHE